MPTVLLVLLASTGCENAGSAGQTEPSAGEATSPVKPEDFDLERAADLVRRDRVEDGEALEQAINRDRRNRVDVDGDGKRDRLQVVERRDPNARELEVRAIPSSRRGAEPDSVAVPIATFGFVPVGEIARVTVRYADVVAVDEPPEIAFNAPLAAGTFCHWVLIIDRPIYAGTAVVVVHQHKHRKHKHKQHKHKKHKHKKHKHKKLKHRKFRGR